MGSPMLSPASLQRPAAMQQPTQLPPSVYQPIAQPLSKPAPTLGQPLVPLGGRPGELPRPPTRVAPPLPPAPMQGATGPGTASPGMVRGGGIPLGEDRR